MCNLSDFDDPSEDLEEDHPPTLVPMPPRLAAHQFQSMTTTVSEESGRSSPRSGMVILFSIFGTLDQMNFFRLPNSSKY